MTWRMISLALCAGLLLPPLALAQGSTGSEKLAMQREAIAGRSTREQMYEDIEIMRRLLNGKLQGFAPAGDVHRLAVVNNACTSCHLPGFATGVACGDINNDGHLDLILANPHGSVQLYRNLGNGKFVDVTNKAGILADYHSSLHRAHLLAGSVSLDTEGTYLKGHGIVYTLTLSPPARDPRPQVPNQPPKPLSDWERIRKEIRREKPHAEETAKPQKEPTLSDIILKLLAENGRHFTQLGENESLTVAITFRAPQAASNVNTSTAVIDYDGDGLLDVYVTGFVDAATVQSPQPAKEDKPQSKPATQDTNHKKVQDLILLGELHLKQSKTEEAVKALRQALEINPEGQQAVTASRLLAQALLAAQKDEEASKVLQKAVEFLKKQQAKPAPKAEPTPAPQPAPLPSKLIISAPKKLLDQVAAGKISFDEFQKQATVEYVTFPAEKK